MTATLPSFVIAGTQKGGTTWLEHQLGSHPVVFTPRRQLHFFDRHYDRGPDWYAARLARARPGQVVGEKTTEYFDTEHGDLVPRRMAESLPELKVIVILRDPARRATSALQHMVCSGLEPLPADPERALYEDRDRPAGQGHRYIERGFYADQLAALHAHVDPARVLVLIFEEDIAADPESCWTRVCAFLGIERIATRAPDGPVNRLRLSVPAIRLSRALHGVRYARGIIRQIDRRLGLQVWQPEFSGEACRRLRALYAPHNERLFEMLGRRIPAWQEAGTDA